MDEQVEPRNAQRIAPILWQGRFLILASVAVMLVLAFIYTERSAKVYEATGILQVSIPNESGSINTTAANQGLAQNYATLLVSPGFLDEIRPHVDRGRLTSAELESRLSTGALPDTALVELHSTGPSPAAAQALGREVAYEFLANVQSEAASATSIQEKQIEASNASLSASIAALRASAGATLPSTLAKIGTLEASQRALIGQSATLVASGLAQGTSVALSAPPAASANPIKPRRSLNLLAGLLLGVLLGIGVVWVRHILRPGVQSGDEAAALLGDVPILASISIRPKLIPKDPVLLEAYSMLQMNLVFAMRNQGFRMMTFVGPNPQVGKTSAVEGLAEVAVRWGRNVLVVDGDMRAGTLSKRLGQDVHVGLTELLQGSIDLEEALITLSPGLSLLPTRPSAINPPSLLSGSRMRALSADLREEFDVVLIDSPPIATLADGLILASLSDAVVMVVRTNLTTPNDLTAAAASLRQINTPIAGLVVFEEQVVEPYYYHPVAEDGDPRARDHAVYS
jgi:succinoglycan biosynthesis transport protein ExoP